MLQFIVLGIVPGTSIQLDFNQILLIALSVLLVVSTASYLQTRLMRRKIKQMMFTLMAL